jgi:hypothetical protein
MERVDSGATDDSPFASSLTTPVDEDVQLQLYQNHGLGMGIEERLFGLSNGKGGGGVTQSASAIQVGSLEDRLGRSAVVSEKEFKKEIEKKVCHLSPVALCMRSSVPHFCSC